MFTRVHTERVVRRPRSLARLLSSPWSIGVAALLVTLSLALPVAGVDLPLCWFKALTGLPCVGCGLTRSVTALAQLRLAEAVHFHPFGPLVYALAALLVGQLALGRRRRVRVARFLLRHDARLRLAYFGLVGAFLTFGVARLVVALLEPSLTAYL